jgi:hypothetical protein
MKRKRKYDEDEPSDQARIIPDFLPSPEVIADSLRKNKITLLLDDETIHFFKGHAKKLNTKYQQMMREVLRHYTRRHKKAA